MGWRGYESVEVIPGKVSGVPLVVGTRIPADMIVGDYELGSTVEEIERSYPSLSHETVRLLIAYT